MIKWRDYKETLLNDTANKNSLSINELQYNLVREVIKYRKKRNLTQRELADIIGTKQSAISRLESGKLNPSLEFIAKVAKALDVKVNINFSFD